jgi:hypothetical protein
VCGVINAAYAGYFLFGGPDVGVIVPLWALVGMFVVGVVLSLTACIGCFGTRFAKWDLEANNDGVIDENDFNVGRCAKVFNCFMVLLFVFFCLHSTFAFFALQDAGLLIDAGIVEQGGRASENISAFSKGVLETFHEEYGGAEPYFEQAQWIETQDFFGCCGYDRAHQELMTGAACQFPFPNTSNPIRMYVDKVGNPCDGNDPDYVGPENGYPIGWLKTEETETCTDHWAAMFSSCGYVALAIAIVELLTLLAACCLACGARMGEDIPENFGGGGARGLEMAGARN